MVELTEQKLNRYSIAVRDFEKSRAYVCAARTHNTDTIEYEALLFAAIVSYYRPFSPNEKNEKAAKKGMPIDAASRLQIEEFGQLTKVEKEFHKKCEWLRNKALAHSEFAVNPTKFKPQTKIFSSRSFDLRSENIDLQTFGNLLECFIKFCHHRRADYSRNF